MELENRGSKRLYYIDWLRVMVVLSLIPFHAALTYLRYGVVYIKEPVSGLSALPFLIVTVPLGDFFMTLLFFVSGVASYHSFEKRGSGMFIAERATKLMLTLLFGYLTVCPAAAYIQALYEGFKGGFLSFLPDFFWNKTFHYSGYGHLWFLPYLFLFSVFCAPLFSRWKKDEKHIERIGGFFSKRHRLLIPAGVIVLFELVLRPLFNTGSYIIIGDWANVAVYLSVFVFGYVFAADTRIQEKVKSYFKPAAAVCALSLAALFYVNIQSQVLYSNEGYLTYLWVLSKGVYECSAIMFLLGAGMMKFNKGGRAIGYLGRASFPIYILHFFPVTLFTLLFAEVNIGIFIKFILVVVLSYITVFAVYEIWRRASAFLRKPVSGKRQSVSDERNESESKHI